VLREGHPIDGEHLLPLHICLENRWSVEHD
jgi:hypothetical protein